MFNKKVLNRVIALEIEMRSKGRRSFSNRLAEVIGFTKVCDNPDGSTTWTIPSRNILREITAIQSECQKKVNEQNKLIGSIIQKLGHVTLLEKKVALLEDLLGVQWATQEAQPAKSGYVKVATPKIPKNKKK